MAGMLGALMVADVFGKFLLVHHQAIRYKAAWLLATSQAAHDHTLRVQMEYEF